MPELHLRLHKNDRFGHPDLMFNQSLCLKSNHNLMVENKGYIDQVRGGGIGCAVCAATHPLFGSFNL